MEQNGSTFIDYYELMQISPKAQPETVQRVYRILAGQGESRERRDLLVHPA